MSERHVVLIHKPESAMKRYSFCIFIVSGVSCIRSSLLSLESGLAGTSRMDAASISSSLTTLSIPVGIDILHV